MAKGTKELRQRIRGVTNIQQITRAMEMVASTKLKRMQQRADNSRPYALRLQELVMRMAKLVGPTGIRIFEKRPVVKRVALLVVTSDKGLCGIYNTNVVREVSAFVDRHRGPEYHLHILGVKGRTLLKKLRLPMAAKYPDFMEKISSRRVREILEELVKQYLSGHYDEVYLIFTRFDSAMVQRATVTKVLPIDPAEFRGEIAEAPGDVILEPSAGEIFERILPKYLEKGVYAAVLSSVASEVAMRRAAMKQATDAAGDIIDLLRRQYNRARQEAITKELLEIVGGAEALK